MTLRSSSLAWGPWGPEEQVSAQMFFGGCGEVVAGHDENYGVCWQASVERGAGSKARQARQVDAPGHFQGFLKRCCLGGQLIVTAGGGGWRKPDPDDQVVDSGVYLGLV